VSGSELDGLPPNWIKACLGDVLPLSYGKGLTEKNRDSSGHVPVYGSSGILGHHSAALTTRATLVVGRKGSVGEVYYSAVPCWPIDTTYFVEETESLNLPFFAYLLKAMRLGQLDKSTAVPGLSRDDYNVVEIPIPPLREQGRIVAEIEKQFTRREAAVEALKRVRANLKRYRTSVLKTACEGRLVPTEAELARAEGRDYEPAEKLLARILKERRARWEADQLAKMHAAGKPPKDDKWKAKYKEPAAPDSSNLPQLPEGWVWATIDQLLSSQPRSLQSGPFGSNLHHSEFVQEGLLAIGIDNVLDGRFSIGRAHHITEEKFASLSKYAARPHDVLVTVMATIGRCCVVPATLEPAIVTKHVYRITVNQTGIRPHYLVCCIRGDDSVRKQLYGQVRGQTRPGLNGEILGTVAIPIPPPAEQERILAEVERRLSVIDELEAIVEANLKRAERLRQAILKRAFEGRLVPQDPSDEPASVLLERIRAEREAKSASVKLVKPARKVVAQ